MGSFFKQLNHVVRRLMRAPMFTIVTLVTIAIGIGANSAIFSVIDGVLLKPLPYPEPERLVSVRQRARFVGLTDVSASPSDYFTFEEENRTFERFGIWNGDNVSVTGGATPERVEGIDVTAGVLQALGIQPILGRGFNASDEIKGNPQTVILTYGYWQRKFGGDASVIGRRIVADGEAREIVGVMPRTFQFMDEKPELIFAFQFERAKVFLGNFSFGALARLKPGVSLARANADVGRMIPMVCLLYTSAMGFQSKLGDKRGQECKRVRQEVTILYE